MNQRLKRSPPDVVYTPIDVTSFADSLGDKSDDTKAVYGHYFYAIYSLGQLEHPRDHENDRDHHLAIVDLSDPRNPVMVGDWQDTKQVHLRGLSINPAGTRAYILGQFGKELLLYVLDVQDPTNPVELARFVWPLPFAGSFSPGRPVANADDSLVIFADGSWERGRTSRLHLLDISDLSVIREIAIIDCDPSVERGCWAHDLAIKGNLVYSTWLRGGLQLTDISDPADPVRVGGFLSPNTQTRRNLSDVALFGDYAVAVTVWGPGLYILGSAVLPSAEKALGGQEPVPAPALTLPEASTALQPILGHWEGVLQIPRGDLEFIVDFWTDEDGVHGSVTSPSQDGSRTLVNVLFESPRVHFEDLDGRVWEGELQGDTISGTAENSGRTARFSFKRTGDERGP